MMNIIRNSIYMFENDETADNYAVNCTEIITSKKNIIKVDSKHYKINDKKSNEMQDIYDPDKILESVNGNNIHIICADSIKSFSEEYSVGNMNILYAKSFDEDDSIANMYVYFRKNNKSKPCIKVCGSYDEYAFTDFKDIDGPAMWRVCFIAAKCRKIFLTDDNVYLATDKGSYLFDYMIPFDDDEEEEYNRVRNFSDSIKDRYIHFVFRTSARMFYDGSPKKFGIADYGDFICETIDKKPKLKCGIGPLGTK